MRKHVKQFMIGFLISVIGGAVLTFGMSRNNATVMVLGLSIIGFATAASVMAHRTLKKRSNVAFEDTIKH